MVQALHAFQEVCYIAQHNIHNTHSLTALDDTLQQFHNYCEIFHTSGVHTEGFNLPRQHSLLHYVKLIHDYGVPNSLCFLITEFKHIKAVKEPWRWLSHYEALNQMLLTNQHLDKLAAAWADFAEHRMLHGTCLSGVWDQILHMYFIFHSRNLLNKFIWI